MRSVTAVGLIFLVVGVFLIFFGTVYSTTYEVGVINRGGSGGIEIVSATTAYYLYPFWSPPAWTGTLGVGGSCAIHSWYTPLSPPAACVPKPSTDSADYVLNVTGSIWVIGGVAFVLKGRSIEAAPPTEPPAPPSQGSAPSSG